MWNCGNLTKIFIPGLLRQMNMFYFELLNIILSAILNLQYLGVPVGYIQQIIVKATVSPWKQEYMVPDDAFRSPLLKVFEILEELEKFKLKDG